MQECELSPSARRAGSPRSRGFRPKIRPLACVLRTLESLGAAVIREGVYLLPDTPANRQSLETLADYIAKVHGVARRAAGERGLARATRRRSSSCSTARRVTTTDQDRPKPARGLRSVRPERDLACGAQAAARVRGDRCARFLPERGAQPRRRGARDCRRRKCAGSLPGARAARARAGRGAARAHLGDAQAPLGRPPRLARGSSAASSIPRQRSPGSRRARRCSVDSIAFGFEGALRQQHDPRHLRGDAGQARPHEEPRARQDRQHRALLEIRGTPVAEAAGDADAAARRAARARTARKSCWRKPRRPSTCCTRPTTEPPKTSVLG